VVKNAVLSVIFLAALILIFLKERKACLQKCRANNHKHGASHKHGEWISIDFYSYASRIRGWNPVFKVSFAVALVILCIVLNNPYVSLIVIIAMAYLTIVRGGLAAREYLSVLMVPAAFIIISVFTIVMDISKEPAGQFNLHMGFFYIVTFKAKLEQGLFLMFKVFAAVSALQMMTLSTPFSEIIHVLSLAHIPKLIVELMSMIYRFIFILLDVSAKMKNSALSRHGYCDLKTSWHTFGRIAGNMLVISLKKANAYYDAMEARCYDGELVFFEEYEKIDKKLVISSMGFMIFLSIFPWITI